MQVDALTKQQKIAAISRRYGNGEISFRTYHELLVPLFSK